MRRWMFIRVDRRKTYPPFGDTSTHDNSEWLVGDGTLATVGDARIDADGHTLTRVDADGTTRWRHVCTGLPREVHVSGGRLLVLTNSLEYHPWGFLGPALLLDFDTGRLITELSGERGVPMGNGRFLTGLEGYDVFRTRLHDRDGTMLTCWRSYGHYIPDPGPTVRVVECDRTTPSAGRVVRLLPDGQIERGPSLSDGQVPAPVVLADGTAVVLDTGVLRAFGPDLDEHVVARLLRVKRSETSRFDGQLRLEGDRLTATITERTNGAASRRHQWTFTCHPAGR